MKFGIILPIWRLSLRDAELLTCRAEELGFDGVFIPDHVVAMPATVEHYGPAWPDPLALLAYLAGKTSKIRLGTSVLVLPYRNPLAVAKATATVDQVSGGRLIFGVGVGWDEAEFKVLNIPFKERGRISDEYLAIIKAAWASEFVDFKGRYFAFEGVGFAPRPLQQPRPPIWVACSPFNVTTASVRRVVEAGDAWHPLGLNREQMVVGLGLLRAEAERLGRKPPAFCPRNLLNLGEGPAGDGRALFEGSPDQVAADLRFVRDLGAEYVTFDLYACADVEHMVRMLGNFARSVLPAVA